MAHRRSFAFSAYLAYMRNRRPVAAAAAPERPEGLLIWLHCESDAKARALAALGLRIQQQRRRATLLLTGTRNDTQECRDPILRADLPPEDPAAISAFLQAWKPDLCLWEGHALRPALMDAAHRAQVPMALIDATSGSFETGAPRWLPDLVPQTLSTFDKVFASSRQAARSVEREGVEAERIELFGPLTETVLPPRSNPDEQEEMASTLSGRPVWLAARVSEGEAESVLRANRRAGRYSHRLLLVLQPDVRDNYGTFADQARELGMRVCDWAAGEMPDDNTQVLLADDPDSLGLWLRLAPVTFVGGTLEPGVGPALSPYLPASLGSAILHGPRVVAYGDAYNRLAERHAVRLVRGFEELAAAVIQLTAPDKAAVMAHAAWECVTEGAALADAVTDWANDVLDRREAG